MSASTPTSATSRRPRRRSRAPRMWPSSTPGCIASPACRSTRAPRSASTIRRPTSTRCTPAPAAWCGRRTSLPTSSACRRPTCASSAATSAATTARATPSIPEFALVVWAAKRLGRPVKWTCERSEAFASDYQGRDQAITLELALDDKGRFLALRGSVICNTGAHSVMFVPLVKCSRAAHLGLSRAGGAYPRPRGADQHAADQSVPQRRAARGDLRHRAGDRHRGAAVRLRPHRSAPPQPHPADGAALRQLRSA